MAVIYRTDGAWGVGKGSNLTAAEVDGNFHDHDTRIDDLETSRPQPDNLASATAVGTQLTFYLQSGNAIGPVTLPTLNWRWRGEWQPFTNYVALDWFSVAGEGIFLSLGDHTSAATFDPNETGGSPPTALYQQLIGVGTNSSLDDLIDVDVSGAAANAMLVAVSSGSPDVVTWEDRTPAQVTTLLDAFAGDAGAGGAKGLVPAPAAGDAAARKILGSDGNWVHQITPGYTVATLPAAGTAGRRAHVTDANATTFASIVAGGGANVVPVFDNGTNWIIG